MTAPLQAITDAPGALVVGSLSKEGTKANEISGGEDEEMFGDFDVDLGGADIDLSGTEIDLSGTEIDLSSTEIDLDDQPTTEPCNR